MREGYIYILSNSSMPGLLKIGRSIHGGKKRGRDLYQTGVPTPFILEWEMFVDNCVDLEANSHDALQDYRVAGNREFFNVEINHAISLILNEYAREFDKCVRDYDWIVDEDVIDLYSYQLNRLGFDISGPEVPSALGDLDINIVGDAVKKRRERIAKRFDKNRAKPCDLDLDGIK